MADDNRPLKYARYAIGEIVLVVIGILIALQINTWNESRKQQKRAKTYTDKLINDIVQDTININDLIKLGNERSAGINAYFEFFRDSEAPIEVYIDSLGKVQWNFFRYQPLNYTFEDMKSSGNLGLLTEEQRRALMELLNLQEWLQIIIEKNISATFDYFQESDKYLDWPNLDYDFQEKMNRKLSELEKEKGLLSRHHAFKQLMSFYSVMDTMGNEIKQKSKKTIELLEGK